MNNETFADIINRLEHPHGASTALFDENNQPVIETETSIPTFPPTIIDAEELHEEDAYAAVFLNVILIICVLLAYVIKENRIYFLPESSAAMILGVAIGALVTFFLNDISLYQFSPEFFFFVLLPPIIFEAGYSLEKKAFFQNIGTITLYALVGTIVSTLVVGFLTFYFAQKGWITGISSTNPMEALLFGSLIAAVDPVATLSIMNNPELNCNRLLYSLVFGESVLNDAIAVVLFKTFREYYDPDSPDITGYDIPKIFVSFFSMAVSSILVGVILGLCTSFIYKHTSIGKFANLESTLLFLFCYLCYAMAESFGLSGIMSLFFNGVVLSHYNSYNLSERSRHATEQIFSTLATVSEIIVFLYMGMGVFTGRFKDWNVSFSLYAMLFCVIGRFCNIFPLSLISNRRRTRKGSRITYKMQLVLWFAGLRGAIAYALAENMPIENRETYVQCTLSICMMTTILCGGFTERILYVSGMKEGDADESVIDEAQVENGEDEHLVIFASPPSKEFEQVYDGVKNWFVKFDEKYLMVYFGGKKRVSGGHHIPDKNDEHLGNFELENFNRDGVDSDDEDSSIDGSVKMAIFQY